MGKNEEKESQAFGDILKDGNSENIAEGIIVSEDSNGKVETENTELPDGEKNKLDSSEEKKGSKKRFIVKKICGLKNVPIGFVIGLVLGTAIFWNNRFDNNSSENYIPEYNIYLATLNNDSAEVIYFEKFIFLLENEKTYLILSISVHPSKGEVYKEIKEKNILCRSAIFDKIENLVKRTGDVGKDIIRNAVSDALNEIIEKGKIEKVNLDECLII